ncbi:GNAT family N-acetyltransferase [Kibdelosporangium phytohabitans]|uniref:GNAT family N-acetyltransferase n=1 Tax=Kibdelosporangium phytohabitans TaxID=860235 RepID=UPI0009FB2288|nr:GNAT family N-acetyltransferase [Kibdelosporangium phytohabitans]MBE1464797.1 ribosomal protein S18 acetylase RimI-like enzyme [Kibdelosporangium phytohabitans]
MTEIRPATRDDLPAVVSLITRLQADPAHHIGFFGYSEEEIADELAGVQPEWHEGAVLAIASSGALRGVLSTDINPEIGRAWLYGPHIDVPTGHPATPQAWHTTADMLYEAALKLPHLRGVTDLNLYGHTEHRELAEFAKRHGFARETPTRIFTLRGADLRATLTQECVQVERLPADGSLNDQFIALLRRCFPDTTYTPEQLLYGKHTVVALRQADGKLAGFAAGYTQEIEHLVDFVAVEPDMRCVGVGRRVVKGLLCELDAEHGAKSQAAAVVRIDNDPSSTMFQRLGFTVDLELVSYRRKP